MVLVHRTKTNARAIIQPQPTAFWLSLRYLQPLLSPDPFNTLMVHSPALQAQQRCDPPVPIASERCCKVNDALGERFFIITFDRRIPLRRAWLLQDSARPPLRDTEAITHRVNRSPRLPRAQKFPRATSCSIALSRCASASSLLSRAFSCSSSLNRFA